MQRTRRSAEEKDDALRLIAEFGMGETARRTGIPVGTLASWAHRAGVHAPDVAIVQAAIATKAASMAQRKQQLAEGLMSDMVKLRARIFATEDGEQLAPLDQHRLAMAVRCLFETVQLATGGLTASLGVTPVAEALTPPQERERALASVHELAERTRSA